MSTLKGVIPKISGVFPSGGSHRSDGAALKIYYDALKNSESLTQAFKNRGTIVFTTAFCSYLPSMAVVQLLIIEIYVFFKRSSAEFDASHPTSTAVLYCTVLGHVHVTFVIHAALPLIPEPVTSTFLPTHSAHPVVCWHRKSANDRIVGLATFHHARHAPSRHARQTSCTSTDQQSAGEITRCNKHARELMGGNARGKNQQV